MMDQILSVPFSLTKTGVVSSYVKLEQVDIEFGKGIITKTKLMEGMSYSMFGGYPPAGDCGLEAEGGDVFFTAGIHAYYHPAGLAFTVGLTHGSLMGGMHRSLKLEERVQFKLTSSAQVRYGINHLVSIKWEGDTWDKYGKIVNNPKLVLEGNDLLATQPLYGVAVVTYYTLRAEYSAKITARKDVPENLFESVAYARWNGGVDMESVDAPTGASEDTLNGIQCYNRTGSTSVTGNDDDDVPVGSPKDITCDVDYCLLEKKDEDCGTSQ